MSAGQKAIEFWRSQMECRTIWEDQDNWDSLVGQAETAQIQYKALHLKYQETYFKAINESYCDISIVIYRGGRAVGIWPLCVWAEGDSTYIGSAGIAPKGGILPPLLPGLHKAEAQRKVFDLCISTLLGFARSCGSKQLQFCETVMQSGVSLWHRILMEQGGRCVKTAYQLYTDLSLTMEEIQTRIRRTNKYSIAKGQEDYRIEIYDEHSGDIILEIMEEFRRLHIAVAGRETRNRQTWEMQRISVERGSDGIGHSFVIFIRDKQTEALAGAALFEATPSCAYYCVAAYDRSRFSKPVGHIVQAAAMLKLKEYGVRWYELGERIYADNEIATSKLMDISHYKEGFATNYFPKLYTALDISSVEIESG